MCDKRDTKAASVLKVCEGGNGSIAKRAFQRCAGIRFGVGRKALGRGCFLLGIVVFVETPNGTLGDMDVHCKRAREGESLDVGRS